MQPLRQLSMALAAVLWATTAQAKEFSDQDGDGIPDVIEQKLGTPQESRRSAADRDQPQSRLQRRAIEAARSGYRRLRGLPRRRQPVAVQDRPLRTSRHSPRPSFIIYMDLDNDPATGRVDEHHGGVDAMLVVSGDRASLSFHNDAYTRDNTLLFGCGSRRIPVCQPGRTLAVRERRSWRWACICSRSGLAGASDSTAAPSRDLAT